MMSGINAERDRARKRAIERGEDPDVAERNFNKQVLGVGVGHLTGALKYGSIGALVGGPVGAALGAIAGAVIGAIDGSKTADNFSEK